MKAAIVISPGMKPSYGEFQSPVGRDGFEVITVTAAALTNLTKGRAAGSHYSAENHYPFVPGVDGVGTLADGRRVYFAMPEAPFGAMAEQTLVGPRRIITLPDNLDDVAAALANPGMSCFAALVERARFQAGETVLSGVASRSRVPSPRSQKMPTLGFWFPGVTMHSIFFFIVPLDCLLHFSNPAT